jgi:outer membrane receptor protein involved in Fe transport
MWIENLRGTLYQTGLNAKGNMQHQSQFLDSVSYSRGKHQIKTGFDFRRMNPTPFIRKNDVFVYFNSSESLMSGVADQVQTQNNTIQPALRFFNIAAYAQDTWKVSQRLTLSYGLRWERNPAPKKTTSHPAFALDQTDDLATTQLNRSSGRCHVVAADSSCDSSLAVR